MNRLRGFRLRAGMTQAELARAIGTTQSHLTSSPRLKPGDSLRRPDSKGTSDLWK